MMKLMKYRKMPPPALLLILGLWLVLIIGVLDYLTGFEFSLSLF